MLKDYLDKLKPILEDEIQDYRRIADILESRECCVNFMPSVTFDLWPAYAIQCDNGKKYFDCQNNNMVYVASIGEHDFFFKSYLENIVSDFYYDDDTDKVSRSHNAELEEMLLLRDESIDNTLSLGEDYKGVNVVYMGFTMPDGSRSHIFFVTENMLNVWLNVFERYSVVCDVLIDSHKGMGDWFDTTALYRYMYATKNRACLPRYYLKGLYIGHPAPAGFEKLCSFESDECSELYKTNYHSDGAIKVIFLDIDGVLNSSEYDRARDERDGNIDKTRLFLLKELIDKTDAKIVLSSSWRDHWECNFYECDEVGREIILDFSYAGLVIYDKTPKKGYLERSAEIKLWLEDNPNVQSFVIFDDNVYGWGELSDRFIQTNYRIGRGLEQEHIDKALELLG